MYVCMYVCTYVCMYVCTYIHTYVCMRIIIAYNNYFGNGTTREAEYLESGGTCKISHPHAGRLGS